VTAIALAVATGLAVSAAAAAQGEVTADQVVTALEGTFGVTSGQRRNHTKGPVPWASSPAPPRQCVLALHLFSGKPVPVVARFSLAGGNPKAPDTAKSARGMALEFQLPDGRLQHMAMLNTPVFGAAQPQTFLDLMLAMKPDPATGKPDPEAMKAFKASHPDNHAQAEFLAKNNPPPSYANSSYFGIHTFKFVDGDGKATAVRWRFVPQDGEKRLTDDELKSGTAEFPRGSTDRAHEQGP